VAEFLGRPDDLIDTPTSAQQMLYGPKRRRVPAIWDVDQPMVSGVVQNQDAYMQAVAGQRPYFFAHIKELSEQCMAEYAELTGRRYSRVSTYQAADADYLIVGMGSMIVQAEVVADYLRTTRHLKVGVVNITMYRPFPGDLLSHVLRGKKGVTVLERTDQPLAEDLPLIRELRATLGKALENGAQAEAEPPYPDYASYGPGDTPRLYSGCFGLGSRDMQPEALIGAVENMLPGGTQRKFFYLSVDFARAPLNASDAAYQQELQAAYPRIKELAVRGSENPNLLPKGAITVRMHSVGGWGAITTGKNLAVTLFELLGYDIKANPKYGSEKKGQPTTYYLSAAPEPIRINCEYVYVDIVLSPDPNVFGHSNPLSGLKPGGVFIIQSSRGAATWASFPVWAQKFIIDNDIHVFYLDAFQIAREEAGSPELQLRMQGNAFQGAFFAASSVMKDAGLSDERLFAAIEAQLQSKFGRKGQAVVDNNLRVVRRGFTEMTEITDKAIGHLQPESAKKSIALPVMLRQMPAADSKVANIHRFWEQTGQFYASGKGSDNLVDPFIGTSVMPAATGIFRDMTSIRFDYPAWQPESCTACGDCYTVCPDSAMPGLVSTVQGIFDTVVSCIETAGQPTRFLRRSMPHLEAKLRGMIKGRDASVRALVDDAIAAVLAEAPASDRARMADEFSLFADKLGDFQFAATKRYWSANEMKAKGSGGLFSITVNPITCKACGLCVDVCKDKALKMVTQTEESTSRLRRDWAFWLDLPTTPKEYIRIDSLDQKIGALKNLLLDKHNYQAMSCGDGACLGCGEKTSIHLFCATVTALMQPRVATFVTRLDGLITGLEQRLLEQAGESAWRHTVNQALARLQDLKWRYVEGPSKRGRSEMGIVNSTGCTSVWASTYPYHPYPFPWTSHLFQDSPSVAMGLFEGHMAKMADGFKAVRLAELVLSGEYRAELHEDFLRRFDWHQFNEQEWLLSPPVVSIGGDGAMYDIGFQNLSRAMMSGMPIKVLVIDTQVYSNTGGQACTSGFTGQVSDMAPYGAARHGKQETRKEISLIGMAHRTAYVLQSTIAHTSHLLEGFIDGLNSRRPALFNIYAVCPPEHGVGDDAAVRQSNLAVEGRAYPLFRFDPDVGTTFSECVSLAGNPSIEADWPTYTLKYQDEAGKPQAMSLPMTFADFAATEARFAKQFKKAPPETWNDNMVQIADFLTLPPAQRVGRYPFIWAVDAKNRLIRLVVSEELVRATEERNTYWRQLKDVAGLGQQAGNAEVIAERVRSELIARVSASSGAVAANADTFQPCRVDSPICKACSSCLGLAPKAFAFNDNKQVVVINPRGGKYADLVTAAEKCAAHCIHPGTPWDSTEPELDQLKQRAAKYN
jgi:pyruvate-ferredoxin/flavodoxin oxidoreductase